MRKWKIFAGHRICKQEKKYALRNGEKDRQAAQENRIGRKNRLRRCKDHDLPQGRYDAKENEYSVGHTLCTIFVHSKGKNPIRQNRKDQNKKREGYNICGHGRERRKSVTRWLKSSGRSRDGT